MTPDELLARYDAELRTEAEMLDADELIRIGPLWCGRFPLRRRGFVSYRAIPADADLPGLVEASVAHYAGDGRMDMFEWKTRGHDQLPDLEQILLDHGFVFRERETVMTGDIEAVIAADSGVPDGYRLERADSEATLREAEALAGRVFGDDEATSTRMADELVARWQNDPGSLEMWLVRDSSGAVVCSGRVDFVPNSSFAGLWGGACDEAHRGRGLYRAVTGQRARSARERGKELVHSDCTEYSRPILERAGLVAITTTTPAIWSRPKG